VPHPVKSGRTYDASRRRAQAEERRATVLARARELFLRDGFARTTVKAIAESAGVSAETVYKTFGGKSGLIEALYRDALLGEGLVPAYERSEQLREQADPRVVLHGWSRLAMEVGPRVAAVQLLVRDASLVDPALAALHARLDDDRLARMTDNATYLRSAGHLRRGVTVQQAADLMWTVTAPETIDLLIHRRSWTTKQYADFVYEALVSGLLPHADSVERAEGPRAPST
jgi:AcrR family transcriptional regulator